MSANRERDGVYSSYIKCLWWYGGEWFKRRQEYARHERIHYNTQETWLPTPNRLCLVGCFILCKSLVTVDRWSPLKAKMLEDDCSVRPDRSFLLLATCFQWNNLLLLLFPLYHHHYTLFLLFLHIYGSLVIPEMNDVEASLHSVAPDYYLSSRALHTYRVKTLKPKLLLSFSLLLLFFLIYALCLVRKRQRQLPLGYTSYGSPWRSFFFTPRK